MKVSLRPTTRDAIIEAAFDVFSRDPSASLSQIADRAGVGRATLHRYFASRDELIRALALLAMNDMDTAAEAACEKANSYSDAFKEMLTALIPLGDRHGFLAREPLDADPEMAQAIERQRREIREMAKEAKDEGLFDQSIPTDWVAQAFDHLLYAAWESVKSGETTHKQAADLAWRTLTIGLNRKKK